VNRLRIGFSLTIILGAIWAFSSLMDSLLAFGIGLAVAMVGVIGYGCVDYVDFRRDEELSRGRDLVWERRIQSFHGAPDEVDQ